MRATVGGSLARDARITALCALYVSVLVTSTSTDGEGVGTENLQDENSSNTENPITSPANPEQCKISRIDVGQNVEVAERCACNASRPPDGDDYGGEYYDYDNDDSDMDVFVPRSNDEADASELAETDKEFVNVTTGASTSENAPTALPSGASGMVRDGTPCVVSKERFRPKIVAGVCRQGHCDKSNRTTYIIPTTRRPPYDPFAYHCKVNTTFINSKLEVALECVAICIEGNNGTWNETKLDDGRLCALDMGRGRGDYVSRTGVCRNGSCVTADFTPWTHPNGCIEATTRRNGRVLAVRCTDYCNNQTTQRLTDGTPCLLNHERRVKVPRYFPSLIVEGICKNGECIITPPTVPLMIVNVPEEGCVHFISSVSYTEKVEATCSRLCGNKSKSVKRGTHCALKTAGRWSKVSEVGQCVDTECLDKVPDSPPLHEPLNPNSYNCRSSNYITVIERKLIVVKSCQVECGYGIFENRKDGVRCLLEYNSRRTKVQQNGPHGTYIVGVCKSGYCTLGKHPLNATTQD